MFCTHGSGVDTTERLVYPPGTFPAPTPTTPQQVSASRKDSGQQTYFATQDKKLQFWPFSGGPEMQKGDGDGTVNIRSLKVSLPVSVLLWSALFKAWRL